MSKRSRTALIIVLVVLLGIAVAGAGYIGYRHLQTRHAAQLAAQQQAEAAGSTETVHLANNPIDFDKLRADNAEIHAWISIPGTEVDYPVCQSETDDSFYLTHDSTGAYSDPGAIYFERANAQDFSNYVTLLYGHDGFDNLMFGTLHRFEDPEFFAANDTMYIYTPGHILTYTIVAAYLYDDRHILASNQFSSPSVRQEYYDSIVAMDSIVMNKREGITLSADDRIVQLSTCMDEYQWADKRYIVTGVLVDDQATY